MKLDRFLGSMYYKQRIILIDDHCNRIVEASAQDLWRKGGHWLERKIDVFQANTNGEIVITLKRDRDE